MEFTSQGEGRGDAKRRRLMQHGGLTSPSHLAMIPLVNPDYPWSPLTTRRTLPPLPHPQPHPHPHPHTHPPCTDDHGVPLLQSPCHAPPRHNHRAQLLRPHSPVARSSRWWERSLGQRSERPHACSLLGEQSVRREVRECWRRSRRGGGGRRLPQLIVVEGGRGVEAGVERRAHGQGRG